MSYQSNWQVVLTKINHVWIKNTDNNNNNNFYTAKYSFWVIEHRAVVNNRGIFQVYEREFNHMKVKDIPSCLRETLLIENASWKHRTRATWLEVCHKYIESSCGQGKHQSSTKLENYIPYKIKYCQKHQCNISNNLKTCNGFTSQNWSPFNG